MLYARDATGASIRPTTTGERAECPSCDTVMIAHVGTRVIPYWAHASLEDCDPWAEKFSTAEGHQWHLDWQESVDPNLGRTEVPMTVKGVRHRADIVAADGTIIEVQSSQITAADIHEREQFYGSMIWIWNTTKAFSEDRLGVEHIQNPVQDEWRHFEWTRPRISILDCQRPTFFDLGNGWLLRVGELRDGRPVTGEGMLVAKEQMIHWITYGPPRETASDVLAKKRDAERIRVELTQAKREGRLVLPNGARRLFPDTNQCSECGEPFEQPGLLTRCAAYHIGGKLRV